MIQGLKLLASWEQKCDPKSAQLKVFLRSNISFIVYRLSEVINDKRKDIESKIVALESLREVIHVVEDGIFLVTPRVIAILSSAAQNPALIHVAPDIWSIFLKHFSLTNLSSNLTLITAIFTDIILDMKIEKVNRDRFMEVFQEFLECWKPKVFDELKQLPYISLITGFRKYCDDVSLKSDIKLQLLKINLLLSNNSFTVIKVTLMYLATILKKWIKIEHLLQTGMIDDSIKELLIALLNVGKRIGPGNIELEQLVVSCIGLLGAIDPDYFEGIQMTSHQSVNRLQLAHNKVELKRLSCSFLRSFLVPHFRSVKDARTQDRYAYAIQEVLKLCEFHPDLPMVSDNSQMKLPMIKSEVLELWLSFDQDTKTSVYPLLKTKYKMAIPSVNMDFPFLTRVNGFQDWISKITAKLCLAIKGHVTSPLFESLSGLVYSDSKAASYILPFVVLHTIVADGSSGSFQDLLQEIQLVLSNATQNSDINSLSTKVRIHIFSFGSNNKLFRLFLN